MTEPRPADKEALEAVREMVRRAGHEIRNALSGVAVNVEVVRSRSERGGSEQDLSSFAGRAQLQTGVATALSDGLIALISAVISSAADGTLKNVPGHGAQSQTELMIYGDGAQALLADIERLASLIGVSVEQRGQSVILRVLPEGKSHSKD